MAGTIGTDSGDWTYRGPQPTSVDVEHRGSYTNPAKQGVTTIQAPGTVPPEPKNKTHGGRVTHG